MALKITKTTNVNGYSSVTPSGGTPINVISLNGNVNYEASTYNVNTSIIDRTAYKANKEECDADIDEFYDYMDALLDTTNE